ncbi:hypothetical protein PROFUN_04844 [Planoprotostelium fungivorum]|uniref:Uncharacterized protein n=1 Tax=Planoprotostelium fungivorum TaxID=1890364 RepID=A0A2P6NF11_9EUKA|nr:hypothetical protein PROFUN_04844 [Planoprotostelium fungivorum]
MLTSCVLFGNPLQNICKRSHAQNLLYAVWVEMYTLKSYKRYKEAKGAEGSANAKVVKDMTKYVCYVQKCLSLSQTREIDVVEGSSYMLRRYSVKLGTV